MSLGGALVEGCQGCLSKKVLVMRGMTLGNLLLGILYGSVPCGFRERECREENKNRMYLYYIRYWGCDLPSTEQKRARHSPQLFHRKLPSLVYAGLLCISSGTSWVWGTWQKQQRPLPSSSVRQVVSTPQRGMFCGHGTASPPQKGIWAGEEEYLHEITDQNYHKQPRENSWKRRSGLGVCWG